MSVDKFKFVSPGVFIDEIDESGIPALPERMGPLVMGRFQKGPAHRPVKVNSFHEFVNIFGNPSPGVASGDIWRTGEQTAPTYAAYAVQAWLRNNSPCTVYRVLGQNPTDAESAWPGKGLAGWQTDNTPNTTLADAGGAYGLFVMPNPDGEVGGTQAVYTDAVDFASYGTSDDFTINVPVAAGGTGVTMTIRLTGADATGASSTSAAVVAMGVSSTPSAGTVAETMVDAINGFFGSGGTYNHAFASANDGVNTGVAGVTATLSGATKITLTADNGGVAGNDIQVTDGVGSPATTGKLTGGAGPAVTGTLAAVWYVHDGAVVLTGTARNGVAKQGAGVFIQGDAASSDVGTTFTAKVLNGAGTATKEATFNFDRDSKLFIRRAFNTDPTKTNDAVFYDADGADEENYWLGETFESNMASSENGKLKVTGSTPTTAGALLGTILQLEAVGSSDIDWHDRRRVAKAASTGWFISQDTRGDVYSAFDPTQHTDKLFKIFALGGSGETADPGCGEITNKDLKISIENIKVPTDNFNAFGTFSLVVRAAGDVDNRPQVLERFSNLNLNPKSANYIKRVIGDRNYGYNRSTRLITELGEYENRSKYIRVETKPALDDGAGEGRHPFGVYGPSVPKTFTITSGSTAVSAGSAYCDGSGSLPEETLNTQTFHGASHLVNTSNVITASMEFPTSRLRVSSSEGGLAIPSKAYFGYQACIKDKKRFDQSNYDLLRGQPAGHNPHAVVAAESQWSWVFTLDDVRRSADDLDHAVWVSGSRADNESLTNAIPGNSGHGSGSLVGVLNAGFDKFTSPMFGGFDGFDVTEQDPLNNSFTSPGGTSGTEKNNYAFYSLKKGIDMTSDDEYVEFDIAAMPGITNSTLNAALIDACETRADSLAIVDLKGNYQPPHEHKLAPNDPSVVGSVDEVVTELQGLNINSSYGCTFYPFVRIRDTINDAVLYVPPSVVALGTFSSSQRKSAVWFAPAGFTRGGLSEGSAGLPVIGVKERVTSAKRDKLYDANINPIASFPAEGIVIFGQKTLQVTQSALDRINVRRLLIYLKKEISRIASRVLFDQNVQTTWDRFTGQVIPFLEGVQAGLGLTDFKVVLDEETTTPDLIDRNIMYAKIYLKPARAIEFIALDFIVTRSGASFDD